MNAAMSMLATLLITLLFVTICTNVVVAAGPSGVAQFVPQVTACPKTFKLIRNAGAVPHQVLSVEELNYITSRKEVARTGWQQFMESVEGAGVQVPSYVKNAFSAPVDDSPNFGIAISGGGYRAAIFGAGVLNALDIRNGSSVKAGTGGLLQATTYLTGLSGGSWMLGSLVQADFPDIQRLIFGPTSTDVSSNTFGGWLTQFDLLPPSTTSNASNAAFIADLTTEVQAKHEAGFPVSFNDFWAIALGRHFLNGTTATNFFDDTLPHGAGITLSSVQELTSFRSHEQPFPIIISDSVPSQGGGNLTVLPFADPIFEFNVFEMGSYDPSLSAFTPMEFLGTVNETLCVTGFDQLSFIMGSSSELFNEFNVSAAALDASTAGPIIELLQQEIPQNNVELDVAQYPNSFKGVAKTTFIDSDADFIGMVDGGEDDEVIPIQPLLVQARKVDVILAVDGSSDVNNFADGSSLVATQQRAALFRDAYSFPKVPGNGSIFVANNLTIHPTFFGCEDHAPTPLVIYLANGGPPLDGSPPLTNTSTFQTVYNDTEIQGMLAQTFEAATQGFPREGELKDPKWPACLACAVADRSRQALGIPRSGVCTECFQRYCWTGV